MKNREFNNEIQMKPFNVEAAKRGEPVCRRGGIDGPISARLLYVCKNSKSEYPLIVVVTNDNMEETIDRYTVYGKSIHANFPDTEDYYDLMMVGSGVDVNEDKEPDNGLIQDPLGSNTQFKVGDLVKIKSMDEDITAIITAIDDVHAVLSYKDRYGVKVDGYTNLENLIKYIPVPPIPVGRNNSDDFLDNNLLAASEVVNRDADFEEGIPPLPEYLIKMSFPIDNPPHLSRMNDMNHMYDQAVYADNRIRFNYLSTPFTEEGCLALATHIHSLQVTNPQWTFDNSLDCTPMDTECSQKFLGIYEEQGLKFLGNFEMKREYFRPLPLSMIGVNDTINPELRSKRISEW